MPLRPVVLLWFLLVCPGMAFVQLLNLEDALHRVVVAITLSLALDLLVATIIVYSGLWSPRLILWLIILLSQIGVFWQIALWYSPRRLVDEARRLIWSGAGRVVEALRATVTAFRGRDRRGENS